MVKDHDTGKSKGSAFLTFTKSSMADKLLQEAYKSKPQLLQQGTTILQKNSNSKNS
jgi:hypothetical protein